MYGFSSIAKELGIDDETIGSREFGAAIDAATSDLVELGMVEVKSQYQVRSQSRGWPFRRTSLLLWPGLLEGELEADDEAYLAALSALSQVPHDGWAEATYVASQDVFTELGWEWDRRRSLERLHVLQEFLFSHSRTFIGDDHFVRVTVAGVVRAEDPAGMILQESREHLQYGRLRAAGAVAGVELERRLKDLGASPSHLKRRDPSLEDYRQAAFDQHLIDQETYTSLANLLAIRKRCVHVLDRDATEDEVRLLIEGVDRFLRSHPPGQRVEDGH